MVAEMVKIGCDVNAEDHKKVTPFFLAILQCQITTCKLLITAGADINHQNIEGETALHFAVRVNRKEAIEFLLKEKVNSKLINKKGESAIRVTKNAELMSLMI